MSEPKPEPGARLRVRLENLLEAATCEGVADQEDAMAITAMTVLIRETAETPLGRLAISALEDSMRLHEDINRDFGDLRRQSAKVSTALEDLDRRVKELENCIQDGPPPGQFVVELTPNQTAMIPKRIVRTVDAVRAVTKDVLELQRMLIDPPKRTEPTTLPGA